MEHQDTKRQASERDEEKEQRNVPLFESKERREDSDPYIFE